MATFEIAYKITMGHEQGYANDPDDRGSETFAGIARNHNGDWPGWAIIDRIKKATKRADYDKIMFADTELMGLVRLAYKKRYWDVNRLDAVLDQAIANELFDTGVNMGISIAALFLQRSLNVLNRNQELYADIPVDGKVGPQTISTLNAHPYPKDVLKCLNILQGSRYIDIAEKAPTQEKYMRGWFNRVSL